MSSGNAEPAIVTLFTSNVYWIASAFIQHNTVHFPIGFISFYEFDYLFGATLHSILCILYCKEWPTNNLLKRPRLPMLAVTCAADSSVPYARWRTDWTISSRWSMLTSQTCLCSLSQTDWQRENWALWKIIGVTIFLILPRLVPNYATLNAQERS